VDSLSVLIVEDERIIALDLKQQLVMLGYQVCQVVASGVRAIECALQYKPDVILMDIHLEGAMDGIDAACHIHAELNSPVIFLTAYAEDATLRRAKAAFPYGYLVKPVAPRELNATIQMAAVRQIAQQQLVEHADRMRQALEVALLDIWEWDAESDKLSIYNLVQTNYAALCSPLCESLTHFYSRIDKRDLADVKNCMESALAKNTSANVVFRTRSLNQSPRWIEAHAKRLDSHGDGAGKVIGVVQDITERRRNEERLRQSVVVFESTSEGIVILDEKCRVVSVNPAFSHLTGYESDDVNDWKDITPLYAQTHSHCFFESLSGAANGQWQGNISYRKKNGQLLSVWETVNVVLESGGNVGNYVIVFSDIGAMLSIQEQLEYLAKHDSLTGLYNRRMFLERLEGEIILSNRSQRLLGVLLIDLDHFKTINDSLGHAAGDMLLKEVAQRLLGIVRKTDTVARLGGDEFTILLNDLEHVSAIDHMAQKILQKLGEPFKLDEHVCYITGSIGIAVAPSDGSEMAQLVKNADQAMYGAKHAGRNCYSFFAPFMQKASEMRLKIANSLHDALAQQQFWVAYQPIVELANGRIHKAEALLRWDHPVNGAISPAIFVPIAEETGVIYSISDWVFEQVTQRLRAWRGQGCPELQISINASPLQFRSQNNLLKWLDQLVAIDLPGSALVIEITEGLLLESSPIVTQCLAACRECGVQISLDDFGTGYSSLSYLKKFAMDYVKIDQSFVKNLCAKSDDLALCEAIIVMAHKLGLRVIAEGIETPEQMQLLRNAGCDFGQGYFFSRPISAERFAKLLQR